MLYEVITRAVVQPRAGRPGDIEGGQHDGLAALHRDLLEVTGPGVGVAYPLAVRRKELV